MESSVASRISPKLYTGEISKLYKADINAESELFEINIFNTTLHIAPGRSIKDETEDNLVYFYVYAIKENKVVANLGVYELLTDEQKIMYDISTFETFLLFDYYYSNPGKIKEFEITGKNNIFDYIRTHLKFDTKRCVGVYNDHIKHLKSGVKEELGELYTSYKKILAILEKDMRTRGIDDEKITKIKEYVETKPDVFKLSLAILESFLEVNFLLTDKGANVTDFRDKTPEFGFAPKQYIVVSMDQSFVSTSKSNKLNALSLVVEEGEDESGLGAEEPSGKSKPLETELVAKPKAESKAESKDESKAESKTESKRSKPKADSKAESKTESTVDESAVTVPKVTEPKVRVSRSAESKAESKKSKAQTELDDSEIVKQKLIEYLKGKGDDALTVTKRELKQQFPEYSTHKELLIETTQEFITMLEEKKEKEKTRAPQLSKIPKVKSAESTSAVRSFKSKAAEDKPETETKTDKPVRSFKSKAAP